MIVAMLACATAANANRFPDGEDLVRVQIYYQQSQAVQLDGMELAFAQSKASRLLAEAGIRLEWRSGKMPEGSKGVHLVLIKFLESAPEHFSNSRGVLGAATLHGTLGEISVFDDRLTACLSYCGRSDRWKVLGHVLAHEIVHALEDTRRHSETGLMKACWTAADFRSIKGAGLDLAGVDRKLLQAQLALSPLASPIAAIAVNP